MLPVTLHLAAGARVAWAVPLAPGPWVIGVAAHPPAAVALP